ncbi:glycosyltransferase family 4 protein [Candidatus Borrarchaeum sp.]|uniref:glycosyltransferase family 4 protein n=1 Tax=Candidatus Borrarchaeum sp. TaxID=2846742 RepID=UPI00257A2454|nr:glycosyltransferase family 4 protein [Candidatus Borrarchaeum sp.]
MKILQVTPYFFPSVGGIENHVENLAKHLVKNGHEVTIFTSNTHSALQYERRNGIEIFRFDPLLVLFKNPISLKILSKLETIKKYDVVHAHDEHGFLTNLTAFIRKICRIPLVVTCHGDLVPETFFENIIITTYEKTLLSFTFKNADSIIALSNAHKISLQRFNVSAKKISVIPNAVISPNLDTIKGSKFIKKHRLQGKKIILFVGQLLQRKGIQYLLKAMRNIKKHDLNSILIIIGKGPFQSELENISKKLGIEKYVRFFGFVTKDELLEAYAAATVFVLPSLAEGLPTVILEAMAFSKPVVATKIKSYPKSFDKVLKFAPTKDFEALASEIISILKDQSLAHKLGRLGASLVEKEFSWPSVTTKTIALYRSLRYKIANRI